MSKKTKIAICLGVLIVLGGVIGFSYPFIGSYINQLSHLHTVDDYRTDVSALDGPETQALFAEAEAYNEKVAHRGVLVTSLNEDDLAEYQSVLQVSQTGAIGFIEIPAINVTLPIYHGTAEEVLQVGAGHLEGTSFPTGTSEAHTIITGHSGLPSSKLFTNLDRLKPGDTFSITVLNRVNTYQVFDTKVVLPEQAEELQLIPGQNLCTLITCTPIGVNTHRLLVSARLTDMTDLSQPPTPTPESTDLTANDVNAAEPHARQPIVLYVLAGSLIVTILILSVAIIVLKRKTRESGYKNKH